MKIKITPPVITGIVMAITVFIAFTQPYEPQFWFTSLGVFMSIAIPTTFGLVFGWFLGALAEETYWFKKNQSPLSKSEIIWGWAGIVIGAVLAYTQRTFSTPIGYSLLTAGLVSFIVWGGFAFPLILRKARGSYKQAPTEQ